MHNPIETHRRSARHSKPRPSALHKEASPLPLMRDTSHTYTVVHGSYRTGCHTYRGTYSVFSHLPVRHPIDRLTHIDKTGRQTGR